MTKDKKETPQLVPQPARRDKLKKHRLSLKQIREKVEKKFSHRLQLHLIEFHSARWQ